MDNPAAFCKIFPVRLQVHLFANHFLYSFMSFFFCSLLCSAQEGKRGRVHRCETTHAVSMFAGIIRDNVGQ